MFCQLIDMTDRKIGWWTVLQACDAPDHIKRKRLGGWWLCKCKCGTEKPVFGSMLRRGMSKSCGCRCYKRNSTRANIKTKYPIHHYLKNSVIYGIWTHLLLKCYRKEDKHYKNYGGKGYLVCDGWRRAPNFINWALDNGWKKGHSLEIKPSFKIFSPESAYWIPKSKKISNMKKHNGKSEYRNLKGRKFGELEVISDEIAFKKGKTNRNGYKCRCVCGKEVCLVPNDLFYRVTSCGCHGKYFEWANKYATCVVCQKTDYEHAAKGICRGCYMKTYNKLYGLKLKSDADTVGG